MGVITLILAAIVGIVVEVLYHKIFKVTYFSGEAILKELFVCFMIGLFVVMGLTGQL
ncbi:hypothetical protein [Sporanaerobium hydrogeniformans]|uniref:hypothetical protein n=1 Tax=Sporanaerobium hydrogeniformans TaxID=3072179 RepID=UPI0015D4AF32|nr:hypothetical protein [Sporanaerobium hydrogeniformans]